MDINNRESAAGGSRQDSAGEVKRNIAEKASDAKERTASALDRTADSLHSKTERLSDLGHSTAERVQATADYMHESELEDIAADVQILVKRYPVHFLAGAAILGFLVARGLRRI